MGIAAVLAMALPGSLLAQATDAPRTWPTLMQVDDRSQIPEVPRDEVICFALYTVHEGVLKLTAQLYPLKDDEPHTVTLEVWRGGDWQPVAEAEVDPVGFTATFRVEGWDARRNVRYRLRHPLGATYEGLIRRGPTGKRVIVAAAFTGNSPGPGGGKIPKHDVVDSVMQLDPDVLLFTGDQVYPHTKHTEFWLKFGEDFGELMRERPTVTIPDDHDVGQPNIWGGGGRKVDRDSKGGYTRPAEYVKMVERQQTSHLPDPYDQTPVEQGIGVYYTSLNVGGIDFAILEDRKFKSGCFDLDIVGKALGKRPDHIEVEDYDPGDFDLPGKKLLGDRQLAFLSDWADDWEGVVMKSVVSQTAWGMTSTYHGGGKAHYYADFDANGWPQTGRNKAIDAMRRCFAFHICGDQHLSTLGQYGVDEWRDAGWWFCVPSIANLYPRWWLPREPAAHPVEGDLDYLGDYRDGFGNMLTIHAHTNPRPSGREPAELHDRMPGFGIVRFDKRTREITVECWPRMVDVTDPANQYTGWPRTIRQLDNYGRQAVAYLPTIRVRGATDPVVQVVDEESGETAYTVRIQGSEFRPKVFGEGTYTVRAWKGKRRAELKGVEAGLEENALDIRLR